MSDQKIFRETSLSAKSVELIWKIPQYSHRKQMFASGQKIKSPVYTFKRNDKFLTYCSVDLYPNGELISTNVTESSDVAKWSSIFVCVQNQQLCQHVHHIRIAVLDANGQEFFSFCFSKKGPFPGTGRKKFFRQSVLDNLANNLLPDDTLTICCRIEDTNGVSEICNCPKETARTIGIRRRLVEDLGTLLENKISSDVQFMVKKVKISAHKNILASRSPVFAALLQHKIQENSVETVKIHDVHPKVFKKLLQFIYTGQCEITHSAEDLFIAAHKYEIPQLKEICEEDLQKKLAVNNAFRLLDLSDDFQGKTLKESAIVFVKKNAVQLVTKAATFEIPDSIEELFIASDKHNIPELKETCEEVMEKKLTVDNAVDLLILSDTYQAKNLKESALVFINKNAVELVKKPSWNDMVNTHPTLLNELYMKGLGLKQS
jgi:BTB/POZ domain